MHIVHVYLHHLGQLLQDKQERAEDLLIHHPEILEIHPEISKILISDINPFQWTLPSLNFELGHVHCCK